MSKFHVFIQEVCLYINFSEILAEIIVVCKEWKDLLVTEPYFLYWVRRKFNLGLDISRQDLISLYSSTSKNSILNFAAWKTDGGCSNEEYSNSFKNMWEYNGTPFSTFYLHTEKPLNKNINCLAVFEGGLKDKSRFFDCINNDIFVLNNGTIPEEYKIEKYDQVKCLTIDPLNVKSFDSYLDFDFLVNQDEEMNHPEKYITYNVTPCPKKALVTKIAVSRPFNYTGPVKYLLVLANQDFFPCEFSDFLPFNDLTNLEAASSISPFKKLTVTADFEIIEYQRSQGFYPLLWLHFKNPGYNHLVYELTQAHCISLINVKLLDIDDRREAWKLSMFQPNFDINYVLMIGSQLSN